MLWWFLVLVVLGLGFSALLALGVAFWRMQTRKPEVPAEEPAAALPEPAAPPVAPAPAAAPAPAQPPGFSTAPTLILPEDALPQPSAASLANTVVPPDEAAFEQLQKARIGGVDILMWAHGARFHVGFEQLELLVFATEGFAARGAPELVLYLRRRPDDGADVIRSGLKLLSGLTLSVLDRKDPLVPGQLLVLGADGNNLAGMAFDGFLVAAPGEPQTVPFPDARVLLMGQPASGSGFWNERT